MKHFNIKVNGKVQGVFFRASAKEKAMTLGIKGFVRNEEDGSVYIEAEGEEENLNLFVEWCKHGPRLARIDVMEMKEDVTRSFSNFIIQR